MERTDYDTIAAEYQQAKQHPWRLHVEYHTLFALLGDLAGKSVLDLACGEGFYTRLLKRHGAARVVGVDLSARMIELARAEEAARPLGVEYRQGHAADLDLGERFDLVAAAYLLNYAASGDDLLAMCRAVVRHLRPGGRFVTVNSNSELDPAHYETSRKYGLVKVFAGEPRDGTAYAWRIFLDGRTFDITNYHLSRATHEAAFRAAGFRSVRWHPPRLAPAGERAFGREFWADFLAHPVVTFIECTV